MADQFSRMYDVERVGGDQRTRLAEMLRAAGQNAPQGQMVGGWYVAPSWSQNLNTALSGALGTYMGTQLDEERKQKTAEILRELSQGKEVPQEPVMQNFNRIEGVAEGQTPFPNQPAQNELQRAMGRQPIQAEGQTPAPMIQPRSAQPQFKPLTEEEKIGKVMELAQYNPYAAQIWSAQDTARQARLTKAEERALDREFKREQLQQQLEGRMDLARMTANLAAANRPERNVTIMGEDFQPITMPQSQVPIGTPLYTPAAAKAAKERQGQIEGKANVGEQIQGLREQYNVLNQNMAIPSEQNRWGSNLGAKLSSTGVGQWLGQVGGTQSATARDVIRMSRPGLMQSIVKASGMSAKQIDSNAELKLMLDQATDPTAGYEANIKALNNLDKRFGLSPQSQQNQTSSKW